MYGVNASVGRRKTQRRKDRDRYRPQQTQQQYLANSAAAHLAATVEAAVPSGPVLPLSSTERIRLGCRIFYHCIRRVIFGESDGYDGDYDEFDVQVVHYKPSNLDELCLVTKFSREEIKLIYRGFKQECPAGVVDEERFKELYSQFYPLGDAGTYAGYIFATFDQDEDGHVTFDQFITGMSVLSRGTMPQKLRWVFNLYDLNGSGRISKSNLRDIILSVNQMLGSHAKPPTDDLSTKEHVERMFQKFDLDKNGEISFSEFLLACESDAEICRSMGIFNTVL
ncbi:putative Kv channel-interacting protein 2 [Hypsibius exemplaris]|uniref:Kv channel-interacting protein 2 n=1 Tax=Hypsibius exemplaris TaxID=2072580 RepID=A0A1W0XEW9_HYPEX|nr:putative Kv channel-interacting protein 2 [Hypsibius exemplaris]